MIDPTWLHAAKEWLEVSTAAFSFGSTVVGLVSVRMASRAKKAATCAHQVAAETLEATVASKAVSEKNATRLRAIAAGRPLVEEHEGLQGD